MRAKSTGIWASLLFALLVFSSKFAFAQSPQQNYGGAGGQIAGHVIGVNGHPFDWALVNASDGQHAFTAFSGMSGFYLMWVPPGAYNVSVHVTGYWADSATVNVTQDSTVTVDFLLQQSLLPVPEIQPSIVSIVMVLTIGVTLAVSRRISKRQIRDGSGQHPTVVRFHYVCRKEILPLAICLG